MIQSILILKKSGENICSKSFGDIEWEETLTSGFISAIFAFTQKTFEEDLDDLELGPYRILFEQGDEIILVAFFDKSDSIINIRQKLKELKDIVSSKYGHILTKDICSPDEFEGLEELIERIVSESLDVRLNNATKSQYISILDSFRSNPEILDCDLITSYGVPLTKEWNKEFLDLCLRMIDAFWKTKQYVLDQIILTYEERHLILHKINEEFVLSALVRRNTPIGLATLLVDEASSLIARIE